MIPRMAVPDGSPPHRLRHCGGDGGGSSGQNQLRFQVLFFEETSVVGDEEHDGRDRAARVGDADLIVGLSLRRKAAR